MAVRLLNPDEPRHDPLSPHVAIATGNTRIHLTGRVARDDNGEPVATT